MNYIKSEYANACQVFINDDNGETIIAFIKEEPMIERSEDGKENVHVHHETVSKVILSKEATGKFIEALVGAVEKSNCKSR